tara:strand:+ start:271 stop:390 length:120 start_codon:yes stop_codon:yes gene_type:complete
MFIIMLQFVAKVMFGCKLIVGEGNETLTAATVSLDRRML